ncbi:MAG: phosphatase PAP2 family protein [Bacteroidales bacterium]|nr:phosphatase PAP2 family protein [Bacteroidales bacterium]
MWWQQIISIDSSLFQWLNSLHTPFLDTFMYIFSNRFFWIPLYLFIIFLIVKKYHKYSVIIILTLILTIVLTDQCSVFIKENVMRLRPSHNPIFEKTIHLNEGHKGGLYGFVSSHAANVSGFVTFLYLIPVFNRKRYWYLLLIWALLVSYSRIYNGLHYPLDIIGGLMLGFFIGFGTSYLLKTLYLKNIFNN